MRAMMHGKLLLREMEVADCGGSANPGIFHWRETAFLLVYPRELVARLFKFSNFPKAWSVFNIQSKESFELP